MYIYFATDHAGFALKEVLVPFVHETLGYSVEDLGAHEYAEGDDYPDYISKAASAVADNPEHARAIILGGSGQGEAIVANRFSGVRAAVYYGGEATVVTLSREHNDANVLSLGAKFLTEAEARAAVQLWLETPFSEDERHIRRLKKLEDVH